MREDRRGAYREDGYVNMLTSYGTARDASTAYTFKGASIVDDTTLTDQYISNGLFAKIIDAPAERAATGEFEFGSTDEELNKIIYEALDDLEWVNVATQGTIWTRLFGGALGVMLIEDGGTLEQPVNYSKVTGIEEIVLFERPCVEPDYTITTFTNGGDGRTLRRDIRDPEFFRVTSRMGSFVVHESRCLIFKGKKLPENTPFQQYEYWGVPELVRIQQELRQAVTSHGYSVRMLERCIQAVHKMRDLADKLSMPEGEAEVLRRMQTVDLARSLFNTIILDSDGEDYAFQTFTLSGVKDILDGTCNMLSAVTQIPQTVLFGRSPAGENATGDSDMENYYGFLGTIQSVVLKPVLQRLLDIILTQKKNMAIIQEIPRIKVTFSPLTKTSDSEQATLDKQKADAAFVRAQTVQTYIGAQVLQPEQAYNALKETDDFNVEDIVDDDDGDWQAPAVTPDGASWLASLPDGLVNTLSNLPTLPSTLPHTDEAGNDYDDYPGYNEWLEENLETTREEQKKAEEHYRRKRQHKDSADVRGVGVIVHDGHNFLIGKRHDGNWWGGPGGHIENGETPEAAARRETKEEFGIDLGWLRFIGRVPYQEAFGSPFVYLCENFSGQPKTDDNEMFNAKWATMEEIMNDPDHMFPPFLYSLKMLKGLYDDYQ